MAGGAWAPGVRVTDTLQMFVSSFNRPMDFTYRATSQLKGLDVFEFEIADYEYETAAENPRNAQWYQNEVHGFWNISAALSGLPTFVSQARMLGVDPAVKQKLRVFYTDNEIKDTTLFVEPRSGFALGGLARAQVNVKVGPLPGRCCHSLTHSLTHPLLHLLPASFPSSLLFLFPHPSSAVSPSFLVLMVWWWRRIGDVVQVCTRTCVASCTPTSLGSKTCNPITSPCSGQKSMYPPSPPLCSVSACALAVR
jgi:hypothetical protein